MESPDGERFPGEGCVLEALENRRFVWTSALLPGFRPKGSPPADPGPSEFDFTAVIQLEPVGSGTHYTARVLHADEAGRQKHEAMGFEVGWGAAFDQLVELISKQAQAEAEQALDLVTGPRS